jgi:hypothetical protein
MRGLGVGWACAGFNLRRALDRAATVIGCAYLLFLENVPEMMY